MAVTLTKEQFQQLINTISSTHRRKFTSCSISFNGKRSSKAVETFLAAVNAFKHLESINDEDTLRSLPLLLKDYAATWWLVVKDTIKTWPAFEIAFRRMFSRLQPPHVLYQEITTTKQGPNCPTAVFLNYQKSLFDLMPKEVEIEKQIDIVFGLLHIDIREKVLRDCVSDFDQLLLAAYDAELLLEEHKSIAVKTKNKCKDCQSTEYAKEICRIKDNDVDKPAASEVSIKTGVGEKGELHRLFQEDPIYE